jgi:hypothetical protein
LEHLTPSAIAKEKKQINFLFHSLFISFGIHLNVITYSLSTTYNNPIFWEKIMRRGRRRNHLIFVDEKKAY